jgi:predicted Zn finger-like uncharacterized protein
MFTQCSKCETVFRLSAEALRAAGGQVRCGRCGDVFNALARLAEDATSFTQGESAFELETRADEILQSPAPAARAEPVPPESTQIAQIEILDALDDSAEASLEFTMPPGELDRVFIENLPPGPLQWLVAAPSPSAAHESATPTAPPPDEADSSGGAPSQTASISILPTPPEYAYAVPRPAAQIRPAPSRAVPSGAVATPTKASSAATSSSPVAGLEVPDDVRREMMSSFKHAELPEINPPRRRLPFAAWVSAAAVLSILLAAQLMQSNSDWLTAHAHFLGGSSNLAANLSAYQLRQWGVTGDPAAKGTLRVRASIMNVSAQLRPYPLLRVTLANRFGTLVAQREFEPAEYMGQAAPRMLSPGERIDATLDIRDPGKDAEGFEIDVCVRSPVKKILCAGDAAAADAGAAHAATQAH